MSSRMKQCATEEHDGAWNCTIVILPNVLVDRLVVRHRHLQRAAEIAGVASERGLQPCDGILRAILTNTTKQRVRRKYI